jgi:hypothetical protein
MKELRDLGRAETVAPASVQLSDVVSPLGDGIREKMQVLCGNSRTSFVYHTKFRSLVDYLMNI